MSKVYLELTPEEYDKIKKLVSEYEYKLQIINKAIEYIENNNWVLAETLTPVVHRDCVLEILRGDSNENN